MNILKSIFLVLFFVVIGSNVFSEKQTDNIDKALNNLNGAILELISDYENESVIDDVFTCYKNVRKILDNNLGRLSFSQKIYYMGNFVRIMRVIKDPKVIKIILNYAISKKLSYTNSISLLENIYAEDYLISRLKNYLI